MRAVGRRELDGVRHHVPDRLLQAVGVGVDDGSGLVEVRANRNPFGRRARLDDVDGRLDDVLDVDGRDVEPQLAADDARHVEQVLHQPELRRRVPLDDLERVIAGFHFGLRAQDPRPAQHGVQRRPDLVRQRRQKFVLQLGGVLGDGPGPLGDENLTAQLALADDPLADVFDDGDRADDASAGRERRDPGGLRHFAAAAATALRTTGIRNL